MEDKSLTHEAMLAALTALDQKVSQPVSLILGGGSAMVLAHQFPLSTMGLDAIPKGMSIVELVPLIHEVAEELDIAPDWLNPYFSSFTYVLEESFEDRLVDVFEGSYVTVRALGKDDLLLMKCFAGRDKDIGHALALIKQGARIEYVEARIDALDEKNIAGASKAIEFLDELLGQIE